MFSRLLLAAVTHSLLTFTLLQASPFTQKPHIVFLLVDDWGWANVGYHRDTPTDDISTPHIDSLVKEGLELDQYYAYSWCAPSRSSLLTGRLPIHVYDEPCDFCYNLNDPVSGYGGIPRNMTGLGTKMKEGGYATYQIGKWHAGFATPDHMPTGRGFDTSFGYLDAANDYYNQTINGNCRNVAIVDLWETNQPANGQNGTGYEELMFKQKALDVIQNHDPSTPMFLYYAAHLVHQPYQVPNEYLQQFSFIDNELRQVYSAMVKYMDDVIGEVVDALKNKNMWDNLLLVITSDNGGPVNPNAAANNYPLKGGKHSDWQGGVRVNGFVTGGYLPESMRGQKTEGYIHIADWYSTFCYLAGVDPTDEKAEKAKLPPIDSFNMWHLMSGTYSTSPRTDIPISSATLISGDYKILTGNIRITGWTGPVYPNNTQHAGIVGMEHCGDTGCLYNIHNDPSEHNNLAQEMPDTLSEMQAKLREYQQSHFAPDRGNTQRLKACSVAIDKYGGFWGPFLP